MSETKKAETKKADAKKTPKAGKAAKAAKAAPQAAVVTSPAPSPAPAPAPATPRSSVRKTYKLYIGGAFPRSESGRSYVVTAPSGEFIANAAQASRKDARDAVRAARSAQAGWAKATAYNRGQILYRIAEMLEERRDQFAQQIASVEGVNVAAGYAQVDAAVDRWVWYAGWSDKLTQVLGSANPVAGPYWNVSSPEPTGVVALLAPARPTLLGLTSVVAPAIVGGNAVVVVAPDAAAVPAVTLGEVMATSDLPGGVVNILTGAPAELAPWLASHLDVNALDLAGIQAGSTLARDLEVSAAENLKRVVRPAAGYDWSADPGLARVKPFLETKTVWHPVGI
ncbi:aldehyde dehydrogenase family protein [Catenulispora sp. NF23]|uniref:Aldehyde dehydrogenase family protein n=1 Tax=Catenulispora pinistramenti TaxID=2705254 RepID=A0ABS5L2S7_9ACTN|nr:aldehyde dehydrogenase family protein [Catenulispora pinistramenti]MBS2538741.1 aldehyde dehydrogenase family protein [Catenulispora pinistramenti]MBS2552641.1 aldehyde dehydrogenase family protein [Catenulispora pinistramenti]